MSNKKYCWDLKVAIEHENDSRLWVDEVVKLAHIACPLRVVIGYLPKNNYPHTEVLNKLAENLNNVSAWHTTKQYPFLLIIGDSKVTHYDERCHYTAYQYPGSGFRNIEVLPWGQIAD